MSKHKTICFFCCFMLLMLHAGGQQNEALAKEYFRQKDYQKAAKEFFTLYKKEPSKEHYEYLLACYLQNKDYKNAEKTVKRHLKSSLFSPEVQIDLSSVYKAWGKENKAKQINNQIIKHLNPSTNQILKVGKKFFQVQNYLFAERTYQKGRDLLDGDYPFCFELAEVYQANNQPDKMVAELILVLTFGDRYLEGVKNALSTYLSQDQLGVKRKRVKTQLIKSVQKNNKEKSFLELLVWLYSEEHSYDRALIYAKSLDKRFDEDGRRIIKIARLAKKNSDYEASQQAYDYVIENKKESYYYRLARVEVVNVLKKKIESNPVKSSDDIAALEQVYLTTLEDVGKNSYSIKLMRSYASLLAFQQNRTQEALALITQAASLQGISPIEKAKCRLLLGDVYVYEDDIWEAALIYGKVNQQFKNDPIGFEAKLKMAKAYYYTGNFTWAKTQLDVLKAATTKLIANDALRLSVLISDNLGMDTITIPLEMYARADLHFFQGNNDSALFKLKQLIGSFPNHLSILDDAYFLKAQIQEKNQSWEQAVESYKQVVTFDDLLVDDALMRLGNIYEYVLKDDTKAANCYEKILINFPASVLVVEARKRYRLLKTEKS